MEGLDNNPPDNVLHGHTHTHSYNNSIFHYITIMNIIMHRRLYVTNVMTSTVIRALHTCRHTHTYSHTTIALY